MTRSYETISIVGVGLIGGSIGLAVQQRRLARHVVGVGRRESSLKVAREVGAITEATTKLADGVSRSELIIVCTPAGRTVESVRQAADAAPPGVLVTDTASTKAEIVASLEKDVGAGLRFVGSHPLAGNHLAGPAAAEAGLFQDQKVVVTPTDATDTESIDRIDRFWTSLGAHVRHLSPQRHDQALAFTSHLPHLLSSALAASTPDEFLELVASGWRDTTRVAAGRVEIWQDILSENRVDILKSLEKFGKVLDEFRTGLEGNDVARIARLLEQGKQRRDTLGS